ncbi:MAG: hypothetical protein KDB21_02500, partial [Acidimicrobiales bacterium]|nr:hypothetical protein [Acidimicrobiales bacterium]
MSLRTFTPKPLVAALALVSLLLAGTLSACGDDDSAAGGSADPTPVIVDVEPDGTTVVDAEELAGELDVLPVATDLSQDEIDGLVFMRE